MTNFNETLNDRRLLQVSGSEAASFLNRVLTNNTETLDVGTCQFGALLTPQGKIIADLFLWRTEHVLFLDVHESIADTLKKRLTMLKLRADVSIAVKDDLFVAVSSDEPENAYISTNDPRAGSVWRSLVSNTPSSQDGAWDIIRFEHALPELGRDFGSQEVFPADVNMDAIGGIDYKKGCFVGQEVASRMKRKTEVRKRTCRITSSEPIEVGSDIVGGTTTIGSVMNFADGQGLALIRLDRLAKADANTRSAGDTETPIAVHIPSYLSETQT